MEGRRRLVGPPPVAEPPVLHDLPEDRVGDALAGALCELCVFARRRRHWLAEQRRRRDAATSVTLPVALVPEDDARDAADAPTAPLTSPRRRPSQATATDVL